MREKIIALEARLSSAKIPSEQDRGLAEISQRETEEKILTLTALVTELQVDMYGKRALYDALKGDPNSPKKALREARKNYREAVEQLRTLKESLAEARAEQMEFDLREAKRRQRPGEPKADSRFLSQESEQTILTLTALVTQLQKDMLRKKAIYDALSYAKPDTLPITAELQNLLNQDPFINQLENRLHTAEEKLKATRRFGVNHRVCKAAQVARDVAADRVTEERARKISEYHRGQIEQAKRNFLEAQEQLVTLKDRLIEAKSKQMQLDALEARRQRDAAQRAKENASTP
ncbi:MAG TPA: hypothetical protein VJZ71_14285 [Phycisphaerae bacterium]|nr:hypothetical protein [Phycisphaerae bacterium]